MRVVRMVVAFRRRFYDAPLFAPCEGDMRRPPPTVELVNSELAQSPRRTYSTSAIVAFVFLALLYTVQIGAGSLWDNSEPQYGEIVKEMLRGGDWLTLHKDLQPWFVHPPLWFWTAGLSAKIFGLNEFALRLPSAVFGVLCAAATYRAARRLYGDAAGVVAALALGASLEFIVVSRLAVQETMLIFFMTVAMFWSYFSARDGNARDFWIATVASALGTLAKGPVAILLPLLTLAAWGAWSRRWSSLAPLPWLPAIALYTVLAGAWFAAETVVNGTGFLLAYFGMSNLSRFLSPFENQPGPLYYYVPIVVVGFFPFIAFVPQAVARAWRSKTADDKFLIAGAVVPFVFFSIAQTKLPNYIAAIFPVLGVLVGGLLGDAIYNHSVVAIRRSLLALVVAMFVLTAGIAIYAWKIDVTGVSHFLASIELLCIVVPTIALCAFAAAMRMKQPWMVPWGLALMMGAFIGIVTFSILPQIEATSKPMKAMATDVMSNWRPGDRICFDGVRQGFSLDYYTNGPPITSVGHNVDDVPPKQYFAVRRPAVCVVSPSAFTSLSGEGVRLELIEKTPTLWLARTR
jgi:4-amino-4-deoxy-L-arabinose transferase-like glycosyltransferase